MSTVEIDLKKAVQADPYAYFTKEEVDKSRSYQRPLQVARLVSSLMSLVVLAAFISLEVGPRAIEALAVDAWPLQLLVVLVAYILIDDLLGTPLEVWRVFVHEQKWGFNTQTPSIFIVDKIKSLLLSVVLLGLIAIGIWGGIRTMQMWWLVDAIGFVLFSVVLAAIAPTVIMPLFNKFTPLDREDLRAKLVTIAEKGGVKISDYLVMDASKRTTKDNAFFAGIGATRRVVLFDNLLSQPEGCVSVVVAHEIGHWRRRHMAKGIITGTLSILISFLAVKLASGSPALLSWAGVDSIKDPGALGLFLLFFGAPFTLTRYVNAWFSRWFERQADLDALELTGDTDSYRALWRNFTTRNLPDLDPTWWERIKASHPPIAQRIAFAELWEGRRSKT